MSEATTAKIGSVARPPSISVVQPQTYTAYDALSDIVAELRNFATTPPESGAHRLRVELTGLTVASGVGCSFCGSVPDQLLLSSKTDIGYLDPENGVSYHTLLLCADCLFFLVHEGVAPLFRPVSAYRLPVDFGATCCQACRHISPTGVRFTLPGILSDHAPDCTFPPYGYWSGLCWSCLDVGLTLLKKEKTKENAARLAARIARRFL